MSHLIHIKLKSYHISQIFGNFEQFLSIEKSYTLLFIDFHNIYQILSNQYILNFFLQQIIIQTLSKLIQPKLISNPNFNNCGNLYQSLFFEKSYTCLSTCSHSTSIWYYHITTYKKSWLQKLRKLLQNPVNREILHFSANGLSFKVYQILSCKNLYLIPTPKIAKTSNKFHLSRNVIIFGQLILIQSLSNLI